MAEQNIKNSLERQKDLTDLYAVIFIYIFFTAGVIWHLWNPTRSLMLKITPYGLLFVSLIILYPYIKDKRRRLLIWIIVTYTATLLLEIIGVKSGIIFGEYSYGAVLGPKILDVPILIGLNWVVIILGAVIIAKSFTGNHLFSSLITGVLAVIFDLALEPAASKLGYWVWLQGDIPFQNYLAWFLIAFSAALFFNQLNIRLIKTLPKHYFYAQVIFFIGLNYLL